MNLTKVALVALMLSNQAFALSGEGVTDTWFLPFFSSSGATSGETEIDTWTLPQTETPTPTTITTQASKPTPKIQKNYGPGSAGGGTYGSQDPTLFGRSHKVTLVKRRNRIASWRDQNGGFYTSAPERRASSLSTSLIRPSTAKELEVLPTQRVNTIPSARFTLPEVHLDARSSYKPRSYEPVYQQVRKQNAAGFYKTHAKLGRIPQAFWNEASLKFESLRSGAPQIQTPDANEQGNTFNKLNTQLIAGGESGNIQNFGWSLFLCLLIISGIALEHKYHVIARSLHLHWKT